MIPYAHRSRVIILTSTLSGVSFDLQPVWVVFCHEFWPKGKSRETQSRCDNEHMILLLNPIRINFLLNVRTFGASQTYALICQHTLPGKQVVVTDNATLINTRVSQNLSMPQSNPIQKCFAQKMHLKWCMWNIEHIISEPMISLIETEIKWPWFCCSNLDDIELRNQLHHNITIGLHTKC